MVACSQSTGQNDCLEDPVCLEERQLQKREEEIPLVISAPLLDRSWVLGKLGWNCCGWNSFLLATGIQILRDFRVTVESFKAMKLLICLIGKEQGDFKWEVLNGLLNLWRKI